MLFLLSIFYQDPCDPDNRGSTVASPHYKLHAVFPKYNNAILVPRKLLILLIEPTTILYQLALHKYHLCNLKFRFTGQ